MVKLALKETELSPLELAVTFTDTESYFVSEASTYRILKARDLISSPAFIAIKAASEFKDKSTAINQLWQTDFTYIKVLGWGWFYLSIRPLSSDQWRTRAHSSTITVATSSHGNSVRT